MRGVAPKDSPWPPAQPTEPPILLGTSKLVKVYRADGVTVEATPLTPVIEELAHAVLAQRRHGRELPPALHLFAHLFDANVDDELP